uniref:Uncharacterized protein n=1 Tax=Anguilla anguilla TaxID=7936 RepID=A0A0E9TAU4_ANGAN
MNHTSISLHLYFVVTFLHCDCVILLCCASVYCIILLYFLSQA